MANNDEDNAALINNLLSKTFPRITDDLFKSINNQLSLYQSVLYNNCLHTKSFFHRSEPVPLYDFYMPLDLELYKTDENGKALSISTLSCKDIFTKVNNITVLGTAGSGKSTLVKHLVISAIKDSFAIPILIELRELNREEYNGDISKYISFEVFKYLKLADNVRIIERAIQNGGFLFIFDGYDELNHASKSKATTCIRSFYEGNKNNYYLITSRPLTNVENLAGFTNTQIKGLSQSEQNVLIKKLLKNNQITFERVINEISSKKNESYRTFLQNPLLLSLFLVTFDYHPTLPRKKSLYYDKVFQTLYEKHNSVTKVNHTTKFYSTLTEDEFRSVLEIFSFISYFQQLYEFTYEKIRIILDSVKKHYSSIDLEINLLIKDFTENICIWVKDGDYYSFSHRSLQEYFTSRYILRTDIETKTNICNYLSEFFNTNYNLIELIAEESDLIYYKKVLIPYIRQFISNHFKTIDGNSLNINIMMDSYTQFKHLINLDINLSSIYQDFIDKNKHLTFKNENLFNSIISNKEELNEILLINDRYGELEDLFSNYINLSISKNSRIMHIAFGKNI